MEANREQNCQMDRQTDGQSDRQTDGRTVRRTDGQSRWQSLAPTGRHVRSQFSHRRATDSPGQRRVGRERLQDRKVAAGQPVQLAPESGAAAYLTICRPGHASPTDVSRSVRQTPVERSREGNGE